MQELLGHIQPHRLLAEGAIARRSIGPPAEH
jgi:hypothetical protein